MAFTELKKQQGGRGPKLSDLSIRIRLSPGKKRAQPRLELRVGYKLLKLLRWNPIEDTIYLRLLIGSDEDKGLLLVKRTISDTGYKLFDGSKSKQRKPDSYTGRFGRAVSNAQALSLGLSDSTSIVVEQDCFEVGDDQLLIDVAAAARNQ